MAKVIIMPKLGFTQEEGSLMGWHKKVGDTVKKGEPFFDVHTDKSVVTIDATEDGTLLKIAVENDAAQPQSVISIAIIPISASSRNIRQSVLNITPPSVARPFPPRNFK